MLAQNLYGGVFLHRWGPRASPSGDNTLLVATLRAGSAFVDPVSGLHVTVPAMDASSALLTLDGYLPTCSPAAPTVTVSPTTTSVTSLACDAAQTVDLEVCVDVLV
jgi:hypothetical protein